MLKSELDALIEAIEQEKREKIQEVSASYDARIRSLRETAKIYDEYEFVDGDSQDEAPTRKRRKRGSIPKVAEAIAEALGKKINGTFTWETVREKLPKFDDNSVKAALRKLVVDGAIKVKVPGRGRKMAVYALLPKKAPKKPAKKAS